MVKSQVDNHDSLCSRFTISYYNKEGILNPPHSPSFINQFFPGYNETALEWEAKNIRVVVCISIDNFAVLFRATVGDTFVNEKDTRSILGPIFDIFPKDCLFLDEEQWKDSQAMLFKDTHTFTPTARPNLFISKGSPSENNIIAHLNERIQPLLLFYIDGASPIDPTDSRWNVHFLHDLNGSFHGYASTYSFFKFPSSNRLRISQFFILPPFQRTGLGSLLYRDIVELAMKDSNIEEIVVEDPSDSFSDLRLINDTILSQLHSQYSSKLSPLQREEVEIYSALLNESDDEFGEWRRRVKKYLLKKYPECSSATKEEKFAILDRLFGEEYDRYKRLASHK